jgi:hypothetical protein
MVSSDSELLSLCDLCNQPVAVDVDDGIIAAATAAAAAAAAARLPLLVIIVAPPSSSMLSLFPSSP